MGSSLDTPDAQAAASIVAARSSRRALAGLILLAVVSAAGCPGSLRSDSTSPGEWVEQLGGGYELDSEGRLHFVNLSGTDVRDEQLAQLAREPQLEKLWLYETPITDQGLAHLRSLRQLRVLVLARTRITDRGLVHLRSLENLEELYLYETYVSDPAVENLNDFLSGARITY